MSLKRSCSCIFSPNMNFLSPPVLKLLCLPLSDVISGSGGKVRSTINFYVRIITSYCSVVQPETRLRDTFVRQLISHFGKGALGHTLLQHAGYSLRAISICHRAVSKISLSGVKIFSCILFQFISGTETENVPRARTIDSFSCL